MFPHFFSTNLSPLFLHFCLGDQLTVAICFTSDDPVRAALISVSWLFNHWRAVAHLFGFSEYDAPILESEELYKRKAGEEITAQMYNFVAKDKTAVALRPEMTPSLARLILKQGADSFIGDVPPLSPGRKMLLPIRWYSIPQCWRFENTMRGRKREHYQWNMDIMGVATITAEAELLAAIVTFFKRVGLTSKDVGIKINSRKVLQAVLEPLGVTGELFSPVCVIVDKLDKLTDEEVTKQLTDLGLTKDVIAAIQRTLTMKTLDDLRKALPADSAIVKEFEVRSLLLMVALFYFLSIRLFLIIVSPRFQELWRLAEGYGYVDWLIFDASVVRGLAYYTGIVFECFDRGGTLRAIAGGGRYGMSSLHQLICLS